VKLPMLDPDLLLRAYAVGVFPMADSRDTHDVYWVEPKKRGVLPLDRFHLSRSLAKVVRADRFTVTADRDFASVIAHCAEATPDRPDTWINPLIERAYRELHQRGHAHSIECWEGDELVGGLYGVRLGAAFFGESMFSRRSNASKVAIAHLVARLRVGGFRLLDCQFITDHLASLGAVEISRAAYVALLDAALGAVDGAAAGAAVSEAGAFGALDRLFGAARRDSPDDAEPDELAATVFGPVSGWRIAQLLGQTS